ncbi:MAG: flagellar biosynthetic protein FliO [Alphaproteobacteria bacterium]|nr:flagellar biosynthetic protein FliO [Alphaproteobacteria bacterium]
MTFDAYMLLKFAVAFALVMSLMFLLSWFVKRLGLGSSVVAPGAKRRLKIVEFLPVDHRRKLVLLRRDDKEHLVLLGPSGETVVETGILPESERVVPLEQVVRHG